jgi:hypothetical protein
MRGWIRIPAQELLLFQDRPIECERLRRSFGLK